MTISPTSQQDRLRLPLCSCVLAWLFCPCFCCHLWDPACFKGSRWQLPPSSSCRKFRGPASGRGTRGLCMDRDDGLCKRKTWGAGRPPPACLPPDLEQHLCLSVSDPTEVAEENQAVLPLKRMRACFLFAGAELSVEASRRAKAKRRRYRQGHQSLFPLLFSVMRCSQRLRATPVLTTALSQESGTKSLLPQCVSSIPIYGTSVLMCPAC